MLLLHLKLDGLGPLVVAIPLVDGDGVVIIVVPWDFISKLAVGGSPVTL